MSLSTPPGLLEVSAQLEWMQRASDAENRQAVVNLVVAMVQRDAHVVEATVWLDSSLPEEPAGSAQLSDARISAVRKAGALGEIVWADDNRWAAIPFSSAQGAPVLAVAFSCSQARRVPEAWIVALGIMERKLGRMRDRDSMRAAIAGLEHAEQLQRALFAISDLAGSDRAMPEMLRGIHDIIGSLMYAENFFIVLHDPERASIRFLYFVDVEDTTPRDPDREIPLASRENTLTWYLIRDGAPLIGRTEELRTQVSGPLAWIGPDSYDWLGVPMLRDGQVRGALVVQSYANEVRYGDKDLALLEFVGSHILTALERKQGQAALEESVHLRTQELAAANHGLQLEIIERQRAEKLQAALFRIAQLATADISQDEFYRQVHAVVGTLLNARNFFIALLSDDRANLTFPYAVDETGEVSGSRPVGRGLSEYVIEHGKGIFQTNDILVLADRGHIDLDMVGELARWWLGVPLQVGDDVIGLVVVQSYSDSDTYSAADEELLTFVASQIANSLSRRRAAVIQRQAMAQLEHRVQERTQELRHEIAQRELVQEPLQHEVMHDALTGLPNRGYLRERLERVLGLLHRQPHRQCALLYLDVDRFKVINDSLGHLAGDDFLKEIARRLQACVRDPDLVARLAGDEFAILLEDVPVPDTAVRVAQRIMEGLAKPLLIGGKELEPAASIGIAIANASYQLADEVLRDADIALYRAKAQGRKRFELFDATLQKHAIDVLTLERELRVALQDNQFVAHFQPIIDLQTSQVVGYEALIRWHHPQRGLIGPGEFLKVAEDSGYIEALDWWMFEHSCQMAATSLAADTYVTVNVSALHFRRPDFCERLLEMLQRVALPPSRLVIEVTEGSLLDDPDGVRLLLGTLLEHGIGAALDDFGTGYSSLSYLHTFPLRKVKIDRSFVSRLGAEGHNNSHAVVASILALAQALNIKPLAEGIETKAQRDTLLAMGCQYGQGYLLGRPVPIDQLR